MCLGFGAIFRNIITKIILGLEPWKDITLKINPFYDREKVFLRWGTGF
jgi:hypothetical protein